MNQIPEVVALHSLDVGRSTVVQTIGAIDAFDAMDGRAQQRLIDYHEDVLDRQEFGGGAVRAWWDGQGPPSTLADLLTCPVGAFGTATRRAVDRLAEQAKGNAKPGLLVFMRLRDGGRPTLACFKVELVRVEEVQWQQGLPPLRALVSIDLDHVLPQARQLHKAAVFPGPRDTQVWVVDDQLARPADYWMGFLGARANPGERQRLRQVIDATAEALRVCGADEPARAIAQAVALASRQPSAVLPRAFVEEAARAAKVSERDACTAASRSDPKVDDPAFSITPLAARSARTTYDLGDGIKLTGPRGVLEERTQVLDEDGERYVKVRVSTGPDITYS